MICTTTRYGKSRIDFVDLVAFFFWDTDFLAGEELVGLSIEQRDQLGIGAETFGLAAGLSPHPDELRLEPIDDDPNWTDNEITIVGREIACYPPNDGHA